MAVSAVAPPAPASSSSSGGAALSSSGMRAARVKIAGVVAAYFLISISMVFVNKSLMDKERSLEAPLFMTWFQCVVTVAICWACGEAGRRASSPDAFVSQFPVFEYRLDTARKLLPLSVIFVGMITFNNLCLQYVEVSFYNVARSLTIVFNVIFTFMMLGETTSRSTLGCLAAVIVGFFVGSSGEVRFSLVGTLFGVASSVFVSLNSIYTKKAMPLVDGNQWSLAAYNNMNAVIMFIPIVAVVEGPLLLQSAAMLSTGYYWALMTVGGFFGFAIGIATIMQIKLTSPLTHNISGTAKAGVQTVLALAIWQNPTTAMNLTGIALVLFGSFFYAYVRNVEMDAANARRNAAKAAEAEAAAAAAAQAAAAGGADGDAAGDEAETGALLERGEAAVKA